MGNNFLVISMVTLLVTGACNDDSTKLHTDDASGADHVVPRFIFSPVTADFAIDEDGALEIVAFDQDGEMIGVLLATPKADLIETYCECLPLMGYDPCN